MRFLELWRLFFGGWLFLRCSILWDVSYSDARSGLDSSASSFEFASLFVVLPVGASLVTVIFRVVQILILLSLLFHSMFVRWFAQHSDARQTERAVTLIATPTSMLIPDSNLDTHFNYNSNFGSTQTLNSAHRDAIPPPERPLRARGRDGAL